MKIHSAVYWQTGLHNEANYNSVLLKIAESKKGTFLLALVSAGDKDSKGEIASGYVAEEMAKWFEKFYLLVIIKNKSMGWLKKNLVKALKKIHADLIHYRQNKNNKNLNLGASLILLVVWRKKYITLQLGEAEAYKFRRFFPYRRVDRAGQFRPDKPTGRLGKDLGKDLEFCLAGNPFTPAIHYGKIKPLDGFLLCDSSFLKRLSKSQINEALKPKALLGESQIAKRLSDIADHAKQKGAAEKQAAIYLKFI
ncbi:MAG: hypothetical protein FWG91_01740 [Lachnospiraceae bacterium]|nr:hypothetical protein [Lachnospiraceae bacterium]